MRAAVFHGKGDIRLETVPDPTPAPGELVLQVLAVGVCGTDAHEYSNGPSHFPISVRHPVTGHIGPMIPGHEPSGRVVAIGEGVTGFAIGDLVASGAAIPCGICESCRQGRGTICRSFSAVGVQRDGALAEFVALPAITSRRLEPYGLTPDAGALAQPMAVAVHAIRRGRLMAGEHALLIGTGGIGTFAAFVASRSGARVTVVERSRERAESALSLGAHSAVIVDDDTSTSEAVAAGVTEPIDVVYEMSGSAGGIEAALANVREGGRVVAVGFHGKAREIDLFRLTLKELDIIGTNSLSLYPDLHVALQLVASRAEGWADVAPTVLGLDQLIDEGLVPLSEGRATRIKTLVDPAASLSRASVTASGQG